MSEPHVRRSVTASGDRVAIFEGGMSGGTFIMGDVTLGIGALNPDYAQRVKRFLQEYVGTSRRCVPFGGRDAELADLDRWLHDPDALPYRLLAAPAGRGKSALLAQWIDALSRSEAAENGPVPAIAYLPVSIRFRTNLAGVVFPSLAVRLAKLHGEDLSNTLHSPPEVWRGLLTEYLSRPLPDGRMLLLVIDGLDEAADWEAGADLFPADPPPGLRVVVSARLTARWTTADAWLERLGWRGFDLAATPELPPLSRAGLEDVLEKMGTPLDHLVTQVDVVTELLRISEGDPLLVRLYVEDLRGRAGEATRLQPGELPSTAPGLEGYFERWWEDQRALWGEKAPHLEPHVQTALNLLACALGPLRKRDLLRLTGSAGEGGMSLDTLKEALRPLERFVVGDGEEQGYVFSHPRFAFYRHQQLKEAGEERGWEDRFILWGAKTLAALEDKHLAPEKVPAYVVQHYGPHLQRLDAGVKELRLLVSEGGWRAWLALEGSYAGFLADVDRLWDCVAGENDAAIAADTPAEHLDLEVLCALCHASINSLARNTPPALVAKLVECGEWTLVQALVYVRHLQNGEAAWEDGFPVAALDPGLRKRHAVWIRPLAEAQRRSRAEFDALAEETLRRRDERWRGEPFLED